MIAVLLSIAACAASVGYIAVAPIGRWLSRRRQATTVLVLGVKNRPASEMSESENKKVVRRLYHLLDEGDLKGEEALWAPEAMTFTRVGTLIEMGYSKLLRTTRRFYRTS